LSEGHNRPRATRRGPSPARPPRLPSAALDKTRFDRAALALAGAGQVELHHHDFPASLPEDERALLVQDGRGVHYGAERLTGFGDLLYKDIGEPVRLQAPYLAPAERARLLGITRA